MEYARKLILALGVLALAAWAAEPRVALVLEVKGEVEATIGARTRPLRTLQGLPKGVPVTVARGAQLRLTYLSSGLRETVHGPLTLVVGKDSSTRREGSGKYIAEDPVGSTTLVPRSENMRRMGGARHAYQELDALGLIAKLPEQVAEEVRFDPKPRIQDTTPTMREVRPGREIAWKGGEGPYTVRLERDDGRLEVEQRVEASALVLPSLEGGHLYTLAVSDSNGAVADALHFYLLSPDEAAAIELDLAGLSRLEAIVYLEARGLYEEALPLAEQAASAAPNDVGLLTTLGRLQLVLGQNKQAETTLQRALELESQSRR